MVTSITSKCEACPKLAGPAEGNWGTAFRVREFFSWDDPGRRRRTGFALGYYGSAFQAVGIRVIDAAADDYQGWRKWFTKR